MQKDNAALTANIPLTAKDWKVSVRSPPVKYGQAARFQSGRLLLLKKAIVYAANTKVLHTLVSKEMR